MPTRAEFRKWLDHVGADRKALGMDPASLARVLEGGSYAEAEEFLLDVKRKIVLSGGMPKAIVAQQLAIWKKRFGPPTGVTLEGDGDQSDNTAR